MECFTDTIAERNKLCENRWDEEAEEMIFILGSLGFLVQKFNSEEAESQPKQKKKQKKNSSLVCTLIQGV